MVTKRNQKWWISGLAILVAAGTTACNTPGPVSSAIYLDPTQVAFCGRVIQGGQPVQGSAAIEASAVHLPTAFVYEYQGTIQLDANGKGCTQLQSVSSVKVNGVTQWVHPNDMQTKSLSANVNGGPKVDGLVTTLNIMGKDYAFAEALFDIDEPNPGDAGELVILDLMSHPGKLLEKLQRGSGVIEKHVPSNAPAEIRRGSKGADRAS
ncbi:MAG: hypothetical protein ACXWPM_04165 [Bdellovibrionota bacterium]